MVPRLLDTRLCDLGLDLAASRFAPLLETLEAELAKAGIALRPRFYLSTGYGCGERTTNVGLLFTDGFPAFRSIARTAGMRVRDGAKMLRTLRHETGHAFCYAHRLYREPRFRRLFGVKGHFYATYPEPWSPTPEARSRVARGEILQVYAARHPDEDFAICFQTWLADPEGCRERYRRRPVILEKLDYVASAVARHGPRSVKGLRDTLDEPVDAMRPTLARWLERMRREGDYNLFPGGPVA
jgi:hypothetical protein